MHCFFAWRPSVKQVSVGTTTLVRKKRSGNAFDSIPVAEVRRGPRTAGKVRSQELIAKSEAGEFRNLDQPFFFLKTPK